MQIYKHIIILYKKDNKILHFQTISSLFVQNHAKNKALIAEIDGNNVGYKKEC